MAVVITPFLIWGEEYVRPLLESREQQAGALVVIAIILLVADSVAPVPATLVIMFLAAKAGIVAGIIGGTVGMSIGVLVAGWFGRFAVGRIAPKFLPDAELGRLRESLQRRLVLTLACLRSVPVLAETSVILAAATGVPITRIFRATLLPNFIVSAIYSVAADDSFQTAAITFLAIMALSYLAWRVFGREPQQTT
jgi:3-dehydroquinate synthase